MTGDKAEFGNFKGAIKQIARTNVRAICALAELFGKQKFKAYSPV